MSKKVEEPQQTRLAAEQRQLEQERLKSDFVPFDQKQPSFEPGQNSQSPLVEYSLQDPKIQQIHAEQERLRTELERLCPKQERHFEEQAGLRMETESNHLHEYETKAQPLISQQFTFESEKQTKHKIESQIPSQTLNVSIPISHLEETFLEPSKQSVPTDILTMSVANSTFNPPEKNKISWVLFIAALVFLISGGAVLGIWFLQHSETEKLNQNNSDKMEVNRTFSSGFTSNSIPSFNPNPKINETPPSLPVEAVTKEISPSPLYSKPIMSRNRIKKRRWQSTKSRKPSPKPKQSVTIDDILNDQ